jgi:hypothetical protein
MRSDDCAARVRIPEATSGLSWDPGQSLRVNGGVG